MRAWLLIGACAALCAVLSATATAGESVTYQGKTAHWWALRAQQARKDANARAATIKALRRELEHSPSIQEAVALASVAYPAMKPCSAWAIIKHESWMTADPAHAKNPSSTASGLYQFLTSTFASTPYGRFSIWSPYAQSLAAGWMHQAGRGGEWAIPRC